MEIFDGKTAALSNRASHWSCDDDDDDEDEAFRTLWGVRMPGAIKLSSYERFGACFAFQNKPLELYTDYTFSVKRGRLIPSFICPTWVSRMRRYSSLRIRPCLEQNTRPSKMQEVSKSKSDVIKSAGVCTRVCRRARVCVSMAECNKIRRHSWRPIMARCTHKRGFIAERAINVPW